MSFDPASQCRSKVRHASAYAARKALANMRRRGVIDHAVTVYQCPSCHHWHYGRNSKKQGCKGIK